MFDFRGLECYNQFINDRKNIRRFPERSCSMNCPAAEDLIQKKLTILADAAKYDVACTSSGVSRSSGGTGMGIPGRPESATAFPLMAGAFLC